MKLSEAKVGMQVRCVKCHADALTEGKIYEVLSVLGDLIHVVADHDSAASGWYGWRFEPVEVPTGCPAEPADMSDIKAELDAITSSNQQNKADGGKSNPLLLHEDMNLALMLVNRVLDYGAEKYERAGWKKVEPERYRAALIRHQRDILSGEQFDVESGLMHLAHLACNALFLLQLEADDLLNRRVWTQKQLMTYLKPPQGHKNGN